ncbi:MAG: TIGR00266 family protein [Myxococcota bacterium]|nr:TIGR00266 family protein [Myxococcota bacterium]
MRIDVESRPSYGMAVVHLERGETFIAESGSMVAMSPSLAVDTRFNGTGKSGAIGWVKAAVTGLARKFFAGESMFVNHYRASSGGQTVFVAPAMVGDVEHLSLDGSSLTVQATSYLGSTPDVDVSLIWGGLQMLFSGEGAFFLRCSGTGELLVNSYGAIEKVTVDGSYTVDTGHLVAFEGQLSYQLRKAGNWKSTLLSGEGLVMSFEGQGTLWLQTRNLRSTLSWVRPQLPS